MTHWFFPFLMCTSIYIYTYTLEMCGTGTKKIILYRDRDRDRDRDQKTKLYRDQDRDRDQIKRVTRTWTGTGTKKSWSRTCLLHIYHFVSRSLSASLVFFSSMSLVSLNKTELKFAHKTDKEGKRKTFL